VTFHLRKPGKIRAFVSHLTFGSELPFEKLLCVTVVRDPIAAIVSDYYFSRVSTGDEPFRQKARQLNLDEYVLDKIENNTRASHNNQNIIISGREDSEYSKQLLEKRYLFACEISQLNEFLYIICHFVGRPFKGVEDVNVTNSAQKPGLSSEVAAAWLARKTEDLALVRYLHDRFRQICNQYYERSDLIPFGLDGCG
jgi:hypothetical protein